MPFRPESLGLMIFLEPEPARLIGDRSAMPSAWGMVEDTRRSTGSVRWMSSVEHRAFSDELVAFIRAEVAIGDYPLEADTDLVLTGLVDSLGIVLVVEWIESRLGVMIDPGDIVIEHFDTVASMVAYLRGRGDTPLD